jgi:hypothetical protein
MLACPSFLRKSNANTAPATRRAKHGGVIFWFLDLRTRACASRHLRLRIEAPRIRGLVM